MTRPTPCTELTIDVCICTFRRESLTATLRSIKEQTYPAERVRIIIADNDEQPSARERVDAMRAEGLDITYVHAPARNISLARNACLDQATGDCVAWIDDDETADPDWLKNLVGALGSRDVVFGPVIALYPAGAPAWMVRSDFHSTIPVETAHGIDTGYAGNALVIREAVGDLRFDLALGRSGGEDTDFFIRMHDRGAVFGSAPDAVVREIVAENRLNLEWLSRRAFRSGQTYARRYVSSPGLRIKGLVLSSAKVAVCSLLVLACLPDAARWRRAWTRGGLHLGVMARLAGLREGELY